MNINTPPNLARDTMPTMRQASDDLLQSAGKALESTRDHANDALDKAESKVRELRGSVDPMVDMLATKAQKLARHSLDLASEAKDRAEQSFKRAAGVTTRYVSEQPVRSILIAAAVGATVALLVSATRHRNQNRY
ncbi:hypothetical protein [Polaromonas sp.]|uniref:DUF883 family protein n=1 Tax=Polaromonas sp. TaxID=1869339 RepID=UPI00183E1CC6|nr:hypothetical protein [Polaromonas sp.]NML84747.1 hypothetical protein [Polaromonas sp.]